MTLRPFFFLLLTWVSLSAIAQQENLGRLFFSPEQRANMDWERRVGTQSANTLMLNGVLHHHSSGKRLYWLNGTAHHGLAVGRDFRPVPVSLDRIMLTAIAGEPRTLRIGEVMDRSTGVLTQQPLSLPSVIRHHRQDDVR